LTPPRFRESQFFWLGKGISGWDFSVKSAAE
jgi:hypothetical protein